MAKSRKKKSIARGGMLAILLAVSFMTALGFYFVNSIRSTQYENAVYSTMEEPTLPVVYAICNGMEMNPMRGHFQNMGNQAADTVTIVPENRKLEISIRKYGNSITGISYEIRNLKLDHFIEKTEVTDFQDGKDTVTAILPIQNLIEKENPYLMSITVDTGENKISYYTKIVWTDGSDAADMVALAREFNAKTFDYEEARSLTQFMETDPKAENNNLGTVTIGSSFSQLTWGETGMQPESQPEIYLRDFSGMMGDIEVVYRTKTSGAAGEEHFVNTDHFNMRTGAERIYVMNYHRNTYEIFDGSKHRFTGKMIMLGITDPEVLETVSSPSTQYIAYKTDKELWCYDQKNFTAVNIFSFRSPKDDGIRADCRDHDIRILSVGDDGTVDFAVYGYMNRGRHEGWNGLVYYSYSPQTAVTTENFFVPIAKSYENIREELSVLCAKGTGDMFYFKQNDTVYAVDLKSLEMMEIVTGLTQDTYASSGTESRFAWVENGKYGSDNVKVMNITTGATQTIEADEGDVLQILTFNEDDIVLGVSGKNDLWYINGRIRSLPYHRLEIYDENLSLVKTYERTGSYIDDFVKSDNRFLFNIYRKKGGGGYTPDSSDTIVCADTETLDRAALCAATSSGEKLRVYYVTIEEEIRNTKKLSIDAPESISYENSGNVEIRSESKEPEITFYAYRNGHFAGKDTDFCEALSLCYDDMGIVKDQNGVILYARTDRGTYHTVKDAVKAAAPLLEREEITRNQITEDGYMLIDARGATLNQILNFVYKDHPVKAEYPDGSYVLIYGYDAKTVRLLDPETGETETLLREDAESRFTEAGAGYICFTYLAK